MFDVECRGGCIDGVISVPVFHKRKRDQRPTCRIFDVVARVIPVGEDQIGKSIAPRMRDRSSDQCIVHLPDLIFCRYIEILIVPESFSDCFVDVKIVIKIFSVGGTQIMYLLSDYGRGKINIVVRRQFWILI